MPNQNAHQMFAVFAKFYLIIFYIIKTINKKRIKFFEIFYLQIFITSRIVIAVKWLIKNVKVE